MPSTVSNPRIHLQEDNYGTVRFTCIGTSSTVGRRVSEQQTACTDACKTYRTLHCPREDELSGLKTRRRHQN